MINNYGNFIVQKAIKFVTKENKEKLLNCISNNIERLGNKKFIEKWKMIVMKAKNYNKDINYHQSGLFGIDPFCMNPNQTNTSMVFYNDKDNPHYICKDYISNEPSVDKLSKKNSDKQKKKNKFEKSPTSYQTNNLQDDEMCMPEIYHENFYCNKQVINHEAQRLKNALYLQNFINGTNNQEINK